MNKQTPILFQSWKVRKILDWNWEESNMQTRRLMFNKAKKMIEFDCRYGEPGGLLWVRESLCVEKGATLSDIENGKFTYKSDDVNDEWTKDNGFRTISPIHMYKFSARIWLELVAVRSERLKDITKEDAKMEGASPLWEWSPDKDKSLFERGILNPYVANFSVIWDKINKDSGFGWDVNPWVWALEFKRVRKP